MKWQNFQIFAQWQILLKKDFGANQSVEKTFCCNIIEKKMTNLQGPEMILSIFFFEPRCSYKFITASWLKEKDAQYHFRALQICHFCQSYYSKKKSAFLHSEAKSKWSNRKITS